MAEDEDAVYTLWDEVQRNQSVSDATYARAVGKVGEQGVIDVLGITGYYTMLAMVMNTTRTPLPAGVEAAAGAAAAVTTINENRRTRREPDLVLRVPRSLR